MADNGLTENNDGEPGSTRPPGVGLSGLSPAAMAKVAGIKEAYLSHADREKKGRPPAPLLSFSLGNDNLAQHLNHLMNPGYSDGGINSSFLQTAISIPLGARKNSETSLAVVFSQRTSTGWGGNNKAFDDQFFNAHRTDAPTRPLPTQDGFQALNEETWKLSAEIKKSWYLGKLDAVKHGVDGTVRLTGYYTTGDKIVQDTWHSLGGASYLRAENSVQDGFYGNLQATGTYSFSTTTSIRHKAINLTLGGLVGTDQVGGMVGISGYWGNQGSQHFSRATPSAQYGDVDITQASHGVVPKNSFRFGFNANLYLAGENKALITPAANNPYFQENTQAFTASLWGEKLGEAQSNSGTEVEPFRVNQQKFAQAAMIDSISMKCLSGRFEVRADWQVTNRLQLGVRLGYTLTAVQANPNRDYINQLARAESDEFAQEVPRIVAIRSFGSNAPTEYREMLEKANYRLDDEQLRVFNAPKGSVAAELSMRFNLSGSNKGGRTR